MGSCGNEAKYTHDFMNVDYEPVHVQEGKIQVTTHSSCVQFSSCCVDRGNTHISYM